MGWKIQIDSDTCPHLNKWEINCCHPSNFMKPCTEVTCPLTFKPMTKEEAEKLVLDFATEVEEVMVIMDRPYNWDYDGPAYHKIIAALTGKEAV